MKHEWLTKDDKDHLIVFFAGWGMDARPFKRMRRRKADVLMFYDYSDQDVPLSLSEVCSTYNSTSIIAWSLGVPIAQRVCSEAELKLHCALAVNGTLHPADDRYGIPEAVYDATQDALSAESLLRFYRRMCVTRKVMQDFMADPPARTIESLAAELRVLRDSRSWESSIYTAALVGNADRIIPPANQANCWERYGVPVHTLDIPHYPFHLYMCWQELIEVAGNDG